MKAKTTLTSYWVVDKIQQVLGVDLEGYQRMLVWGVLPGVITSCYHDGCLNCFHANLCRVSKFPEVTEQEFVEILEKEL